jgi:hypothetical protein
MFCESGFDFWQEQNNFFSKCPDHHQPSFLFNVYPWIKQLGHEADHISPCSVEVKNASHTIAFIA